MNRDDYLATLHPLFRAADDALKMYVAIIQRAPQLTDDAIEKQLVNDGCEWSMAQCTVLFVPLAFGRVVVDRLGMKAADTYRHHDIADGTEGERDLKMEIVFTWAKAMTSEYAGITDYKEAFANIVARSAEVNAINNALNGGVTPESLRESKFAPTLVYLGRKSQKPWWRFWSK
jgi:hypothetical protein